MTLFGAVIVVLLGFNLTTTNMRIDDVNDRIDRLEDRMDARFAQMDARFEALDHSVAEIDRKLTALIAALNKTASRRAMSGDVSGIQAPQPTGQPANP